MYKFEEQFRKDNPQTVGEKDKHFDLDNYKDWLEEKYQTDVKELKESLTEVVRISDRGHVAWDRAKEAVKKTLI